MRNLSKFLGFRYSCKVSPNTTASVLAFIVGMSHNTNGSCFTMKFTMREGNPIIHFQVSKSVHNRIPHGKPGYRSKVKLAMFLSLDTHVVCGVGRQK